MRGIVSTAVDDRAHRGGELDRRYRDRLPEAYASQIHFFHRRGWQQHPLRLPVEIHARYAAEVEFVHVFIHRFGAQPQREIYEYRVTGIVERPRQIER